MTPNDEIIQDVLNHWSAMQNMAVENEAVETSHMVDMSSESAQAMGAMRNAIALPMCAHRFGQWIFLLTNLKRVQMLYENKSNRVSYVGHVYNMLMYLIECWKTLHVVGLGVRFGFESAIRQKI